MVERIRDDDALERPTSGYIREPVIIVFKPDDGSNSIQYIIDISAVDEQTADPRIFGILMSDLLDHIANAYRSITGRDTRDIRQHIFKVMRDEERFKEKDPTRANARGKTFFGTKQ